MINELEAMEKLTKKEREAIAKIGRLGGSSKSAAKREASRENGRKGGRPKRSAKSVAV